MYIYVCVCELNYIHLVFIQQMIVLMLILSSSWLQRIHDEHTNVGNKKGALDLSI